jgi:predicted GNAT superfamily acetyltransferase
MANPSTAARICRLSRFEEFRGCEKIQQHVWGSVGVGAEVLKVTSTYGGEVLGAFVGKRLAGFLYAFLARRRGRLIHWSHMMAVEPQFRNAGLGFRMKLAHRRRALAAGVRRISWTYDPLQSRNATLNITRLGGSAEEYISDCYGPFPSRIERGLASDRLVVEWAIASRRVAARLRRRAARPPNPDWPVANIAGKNPQGFLENRALELHLRTPRLMVEIPADTDSMRLRALPLARRWRMEARKIFQAYFRDGYRITDFFPPALAGGRCFYLFERGPRHSKI